MLGRLLRHTSTYTLGNALLMLAGFVSFPILTRLLSVEEYGALSLIGTTLTILVAVGKLGIQQSIVRFHADLYAKNSEVTEGALFSTVIWGMGATSAVVTVLWLTTAYFVPMRLWHDPRLRMLMLLTAGLILVRGLESAFLNILRAQLRSTTFTVYSVVRRYGLLALTLGTMVYLLPGLYGFYGSTVVGEALSLCVLGALTLRGRAAPIKLFSASLMTAMLAFGLPMMGYELAGSLLNIGDRYVVQFVLGSGSQGIYSAAYSVVEYVQGILIVALTQALIPIYTRLWVEKGDKETCEFIERVMHFYLLSSFAAIGGLAVVGNSLVSQLATARYSSNLAIIPLIMAGLVCEGAIPMLGAGLFLRRRRALVVPVIAFCASFNVVVGIAAVHWLGLLGAAVTMLVSYIMLLVGFTLIGRRYLKVKFPAKHVVKCLALSAVMCAVILRIDLHNVHQRLVAQILVGAAVFAILLPIFDRPSRELLRAAWERHRNKRPASP